MQDRNLRLKTFQDDKATWDAHYKHKSITVEEFVNAGFYYLGKSVINKLFLPVFFK